MATDHERADELWPTRPLAERAPTAEDERLLKWWLICLALMLVAGLLKGLAGIL